MLNEIILTTYIFSLLVLSLFAGNGILLLYYKIKYKAVKNSKLEENELPDVTIQIPLFNELYVAERIINAVCNIRYPKEKLQVQVLDDSTDETLTISQKLVSEKKNLGFDIEVIHRKNRIGFKAGALREGLNHAKGEFVAIFDADFIPGEDFLEETLKYFYNSKIGMVQSRWEHINEDFSILTKLQALALNGHFVLEQNIRNKAGLFINFNGTGGVWRKECILDSGNWQDDTITEDLDLSYRAQMKGWKFVYLKDFSTPAEVPSEMNSLKAQQFRWTKGAIETAKKILPQLWKSDFPLRIKLQSTYHLTNNLVFPFILLIALLNLPLVFVKMSGPYDMVFNIMSVFFLTFIASFIFYTVAEREIEKKWYNRILLFPLLLAGGMGLAVNNSRAVFEALFNKKSEFVRTPKFNVKNSGNDFSGNKYLLKIKRDKFTLIETFFAIYCFLGIAVSIYFMEIASLPFQILFFLGFTSVAWLSFKKDVA